MKLTNYFIKPVFILLVAIAVTGCTENFEEINDNPNGPTSVPAGLMTTNMVQITMNQLLSTFVGGDMGHCWAQQWSKVQYNDEERYTPRGSVINGYWTTMYSGTGTDAVSMYNLAKSEGNQNLMGVALVMHAYAYAALTDVFGDIPYSEALQAESGINTPIYDTQEAVYDALLDSLDAANGYLSAAGGEISASSDILYGGDYMGWKKFANSLKFRMLMRISSKRDVSADLTALMSRNTFTSMDDEAKLVYLSARPSVNPQYNTIVFGNRAEFKVCEVMVSYLEDRNDPRLSAYVGLNADGVYRGKPAGLKNLPSDTWGYENVSPIGDFYLQPETPGVYMSYAQLELLKSEAATQGWISSDAATHYNNGVTASILYSGGTTAEAAAYIANVGYSGLQQVAEQEWLALYGQGVEAWTEQRRTGFPVLTPAIDGVINEIPSRYTYPSDEQNLNAANWKVAVDRQGPDALTTKVWWNK